MTLKAYAILAVVLLVSALACFCAFQQVRLQSARADVERLSREVAEKDTLIASQNAAAYLLEQALDQRDTDLAAARTETERLRGSYSALRGTDQDPLVSRTTKSLLEEMSR
jgi:hypothetical protein